MQKALKEAEVLLESVIASVRESKKAGHPLPQSDAPWEKKIEFGKLCI